MVRTKLRVNPFFDIPDYKQLNYFICRLKAYKLKRKFNILFGLMRFYIKKKCNVIITIILVV